MLADKVAIVTGGAGGIGEAIVRRLGEQGAKVVATGRDAAKLDALSATLADSMACSTIAADLTAGDAPRQIVDCALVAFGRLDIVVNNAGSFAMAPMPTVTDAAFDEALALSLRAPFRLCREALPHLAAGSSIHFIGSTLGIYSGFGLATYATVKHALVGLMQTLAAEYGPRGVRSNYLAPTVIRTPMTEAAWFADFFRRLNQEVTPLPGDCTADDVAHMVAFLASDEAGMVNGQTIAVDGGCTTTRYLCPEALYAERV